MTEDQASAGAPAAVLCPVANLLILNFTQDACCFRGLPNGMSSELIPNPVPAVNQAIQSCSKYAKAKSSNALHAHFHEAHQVSSSTQRAT